MPIKAGGKASPALMSDAHLAHTDARRTETFLNESYLSILETHRKAMILASTSQHLRWNISLITRRSVVQIHSPQPCRRKLCIACDDFLCFPSKSRLALTPLPFLFASDPLCWAPPRGGGRQMSFLHAPAGNPCNLSVTGFFLLSFDHFLFGCIPPCGSDYAIWAGQPAYLRKSFLPPLQTRRRLL